MNSNNRIAATLYSPGTYINTLHKGDDDDDDDNNNNNNNNKGTYSVRVLFGWTALLTHSNVLLCFRCQVLLLRTAATVVLTAAQCLFRSSQGPKIFLQDTF